MNKKITLILGLSVVLLAGCERNSALRDLRQYISDIKARPSKQIDALPDIKEFKMFKYVENKRRSPFQPYLLSQLQSTDQPMAERPKQPLEAFPLDALRMVGTMRKKLHVWALVQAPDGTVYQVKEGDFMGKNYGEVTKISREEIKITETVADQGAWKKRPASMKLNQDDANYSALLPRRRGHA